MPTTITVPSEPPTGIHTLPPEILASAFESIIHTSSSSDITLILLPLTLVCRAWHSIISHTPRLWGILTLQKHTPAHVLSKCIAHAKAAPLDITIAANVKLRGGERGKFGMQVGELKGLVKNWEVLDVGVEFLVAVCKLDRGRDRERDQGYEGGGPVGVGDKPSLGWVDMCRSIQELTLAKGQPDYDTPGAFFTFSSNADDDAQSILFKTRQARLHSFTSISLSKPWIKGFLGPNIKHLRLLRGERGATRRSNITTSPHIITIDDIYAILSLIPNATLLEFERTVRFTSPILPSPPPRAYHLPFLQDLILRSVLHTPFILMGIRAPALQTLSIDRTWDKWDHLPLAPTFTQWTQPGYVMERLHTLELVNCLRAGDGEFLVRWLHGMEGLVRLFVVQEGEGMFRGEGDEETDLIKALASPRSQDTAEPLAAPGPARWLCPSLMILRVDLVDTPIDALISIARARGGVVPYTPDFGSDTRPPSPPAPPARLRTIETRMCAAAEQHDIDVLKSLVDNACCICTSCGLHASG